jgi:hypothetical protein
LRAAYAAVASYQRQTKPDEVQRLKGNRWQEFSGLEETFGSKTTLL